MDLLLRIAVGRHKEVAACKQHAARNMQDLLTRFRSGNSGSTETRRLR